MTRSSRGPACGNASSLNPARHPPPSSQTDEPPRQDRHKHAASSSTASARPAQRSRSSQSRTSNSTRVAPCLSPKVRIHPVLARSLLTVGSMQKSQAGPPHCRIHEDGEVSARATPAREESGRSRGLNTPSGAATVTRPTFYMGFGANPRRRGPAGGTSNDTVIQPSPYSRAASYGRIPGSRCPELPPEWIRGLTETSLRCAVLVKGRRRRLRAARSSAVTSSGSWLCRRQRAIWRSLTSSATGSSAAREYWNPRTPDSRPPDRRSQQPTSPEERPIARTTESQDPMPERFLNFRRPGPSLVLEKSGGLIFPRAHPRVQPRILPVPGFSPLLI
jgi:hypothetical protein